ncbi:MAG: hypothetical protein NVS3B10_31230 [Polyangiales bacterium]
MRVALLTTFHQRDGIATYSENLVEALGARGVEVEVLAPKLRDGDAALGPQPARLWNANRAFGLEAFGVLRAIERARCDVVHLQVNLSLFSSRVLFMIVKLARARGLPVVATLHGRQGGSLGRRFKMWRLLAGLRGAQLVVHNEGHAAELAALGHRDVQVIPHGMPPIERRSLVDARRALGLDPTRKVIAHFGFLVPDKGVREVLEAVAALRASRVPSLFYWISGAVFRSDESQRCFADLDETVTRLGLRDHVHLDGAFVPHDQAIGALQAADWIVLNYRTGNAQGSSGAISRAFASGRPVAVSEAPVFDDVRGAAHTLRGELATALGDALEDEALGREVMARTAVYCEEASWPRVAERHAALYEALLAAKGAAAR